MKKTNSARHEHLKKHKVSDKNTCTEMSTRGDALVGYHHEEGGTIQENTSQGDNRTVLQFTQNPGAWNVCKRYSDPRDGKHDKDAVGKSASKTLHIPELIDEKFQLLTGYHERFQNTWFVVIPVAIQQQHGDKMR